MSAVPVAIRVVVGGSPGQFSIARVIIYSAKRLKSECDRT